MMERAVIVLALGVAVSAWGHGLRGGPGRNGFPGPRGSRPGGLFQQLVFPCRAGCFDADRTCDEAAESAAVTCAQDGCDAEIQAARSACQADPSSEDCQSARTALLACIQPCLETARSAIDSCRTTLEACVTACGSS